MPEPVASVIDPVQTPAATHADVPSHTPAAAPAAPATPPVVDLASIIPADFKDKEYLKDVKDIPSLFKKLDGAQTLIGKRPAGIPQDNAKPEEIAAFNKAFGVPDEAKAYELVVPETNAMAPEMQDRIKSIFHKAALSAKQAKEVSAGWNEFQASQLKAADAAFEKLADETFGADKAKVLASSKAILDKFAPEKFKAGLGSLGNTELILLASVIEGIRKEYISEDRIPSGGDKPSSTPEDKRAEGKKLMAMEAYQNPFHPEHASIKAKVDALYGTA